MRRLAAELDVTPRALYRYLNDKEDLLQGIGDVVLSELRPTSGWRPSRWWSRAATTSAAP
jgi:Bacterial regulatory proteins, tetR family